MLISEFAVYSNPDFSDEAQYLPQAGELGSMETLPVDDIVCPDVATAARYTIVTRLNESAEIEDCLAFFSYTDEVYVSQNNVFVTRGYYNGEETVNGENVSYTYPPRKPHGNFRRVLCGRGTYPARQRRHPGHN